MAWSVLLVMLFIVVTPPHHLFIERVLRQRESGENKAESAGSLK
jgi:hypothetical protein